MTRGTRGTSILQPKWVHFFLIYLWDVWDVHFTRAQVYLYNININGYDPWDVWDVVYSEFVVVFLLLFFYLLTWDVLDVKFLEYGVPEFFWVISVLCPCSVYHENMLLYPLRTIC